MPKFVRIVHALWPVASALRITLTHISKCTNWHTVEAKSLHSDSSILQTNAFDTCVCCCWFFFAIVHSTCYKFSTNAIQRIKTSIGFYSYEWSTNTHTRERFNATIEGREVHMENKHSWIMSWEGRNWSPFSGNKYGTQFFSLSQFFSFWIFNRLISRCVHHCMLLLLLVLPLWLRSVSKRCEVLHTVFKWKITKQLHASN